MVVREKKRATILNSIDVDAVDIIIDERLSKDQPKPKLQSIKVLLLFVKSSWLDNSYFLKNLLALKVKTSLSTKIEVGESSIHLVSNPWILKAFSSTYGDSKSINAETIKLEKSENGAQHVKVEKDKQEKFIRIFDLKNIILSFQTNQKIILTG